MADWSDAYKKEDKPDLVQIRSYIGTPLWEELINFVETNYGVKPEIEHSMCSGAKGWNVKYRKSGRSLCVLYPDQGHFTALVVIGAKEVQAAELELTLCTPRTNEIYRNAGSLNGSRWLMIDVSCKEVLEDVKRLIAVRASFKR